MCLCVGVQVWERAWRTNSKVENGIAVAGLQAALLVGEYSSHTPLYVEYYSV